MPLKPLLYIDGGKESEQARRLLEKNGIEHILFDLRNVASTDVVAPTLLSRVKVGGFRGLKEIADKYVATGLYHLERATSSEEA